MAHQAQANPGEITWHEGNVWTPDANTPNAGPLLSEDPELVSGINLMAKVGLQIGKATEELSKMSETVGQMARAVERNTPVNAAVVAVGTFVTGVPLVLNFGQPDTGTFWEICSWAVGGTEINVTSTVTQVGLYTSAVATLPGAGMTNLVDFAATAPYVDHYSPGQVFGNDGENVFCIIYGGTNGQQYVSNIQFRVYNVIASQGTVSYAL